MRSIVPLCLIFAACAGEAGSDDAQPAREDTTAAAPAPEMAGSVAVEVVQPDVISTETNETFPYVDPVDGSLWLSRYDEGFDDQTIWVAVWNGSAWEEPQVAPFSGHWGDRAPRFSPDGRLLYFTSNRPVGGGEEAGDMNIWVVERTDGGWSEPRALPAPVNTPEPEIHTSLTRDALYLASRRADGLGRSDIYRFAREGSGWGAPEHLPAPLNDASSQPDLLVAPDESWMILVVTDHTAGLGGDDLFVVRRTADGWGTPEHLPAPINSSEYEYGPSLTPDGRHLLFTSHRAGAANVYRVELSALGLGAGR